MLKAAHAAAFIPKGKVVVLTGCTGAVGAAIAAGIGLANRITPTVGLLILIVRDSKARAEKIASPLRNQGLRIDILVADLAVPSEVASCIAEVCAACPRIDVLISCAAEVPPTRQEVAVEDGGSAAGGGGLALERQFATNVLAPFALMTGLRPSFASKSRVVLVSDAKLAGGLDLTDLQSARDAEHYDVKAVYSKTKQAVRMLAAEAACAGRGFEDVLVTSCHPGVVDSTLFRSLGLGSSGRPTESTATAAKTPLYCALGPAPPTSGTFWSGKQQVKDALVADAEARRALWDACAAMLPQKKECAAR